MQIRFGQFSVQDNVSPDRARPIRQAADAMQRSVDYLDAEGIDLFVSRQSCSTDLRVEAVNRDQPEAKSAVTLPEHAPAAEVVDAALTEGMKLQKQNARAAVSAECEQARRRLADIDAVAWGGWSH